MAHTGYMLEIVKCSDPEHNPYNKDNPTQQNVIDAESENHWSRVTLACLCVDGADQNMPRIYAQACVKASSQQTKGP